MVWSDEPLMEHLKPHPPVLSGTTPGPQCPGKNSSTSLGLCFLNWGRETQGQSAVCWVHKVTEAMSRKSLTLNAIKLKKLFLLCWFVSYLTRDWTQATAVKVPSPNHWTTREFSEMLFFNMGMNVWEFNVKSLFIFANIKLQKYFLLRYPELRPKYPGFFLHSPLQLRTLGWKFLDALFCLCPKLQYDKVSKKDSPVVYI